MLSAASGRAEHEHPIAFSTQLSAISKKDFFSAPLLYPSFNPESLNWQHSDQRIILSAPKRIA
jgi:hypothetical protein